MKFLTKPFLEQWKLARQWTCLYLTYDLLQNHFYTHFFSLVMLSSLEVQNIKERKGERTLICSEQLADGQNTQKWFEEHQQVTLIAATAATTDEDDGMTSKLAP